jgi:hypothetical protein
VSLKWHQRIGLLVWVVLTAMVWAMALNVWWPAIWTVATLPGVLYVWKDSV